MKIMLDLDPKVIEDTLAKAKALGVTPGDVVRDALSDSGRVREFRADVKHLVINGKTDAEIATALHSSLGWVGDVRRDLGLRPNRRYVRAEGECINGHVVADDCYTDPRGKVRCRGCQRLWDRTRRLKIAQASA